MYKKARSLVTSSPDSNEPFEGISTALHLKQLELMHHYSTCTYHTIGFRNGGPRMQQIDVPKLAISHDFLLDAVFALTSLHLAFQRPEEAGMRIADAMRYQARALSACRTKVENLTADECQALFHCSAKLGVIALAFRVVDPETIRETRPTETIRQLAQLWRGTGLILRASRALVDSQAWNMFFLRPQWSMRNGSVLGYQSQVYLDRLKAKAKAVPSAVKSTNDDGIEASAIYQQTIEHLETLFHASEPEHSRIVAWMVFIPAQFMDFLGQEQPLANAIVLMYSLLMREMDSFWWAQTIRQQLVEELTPVVAASDPELAEIATFVERWTKSANELADDVSSRTIAAPKDAK